MALVIDAAPLAQFVELEVPARAAAYFEGVAAR
jgi:hypothetical protein